MIAGSRELEAQGEKRDAADFALWKMQRRKHIMRWKSPWVRGFPLAHRVLCNATKYLNTFRHSWWWNGPAFSTP